MTSQGLTILDYISTALTLSEYSRHRTCTGMGFKALSDDDCRSGIQKLPLTQVLPACTTGTRSRPTQTCSCRAECMPPLCKVRWCFHLKSSSAAQRVGIPL